MLEVASLAMSAGRRVMTAYRAVALRRALRPLLSLDDRMLRDIGLTRGDVVDSYSSRLSFDRVMRPTNSVDAISDGRLALADNPIRNECKERLS